MPSTIADLCAHPGDRLPELDAHGAGAEDEQPARDLAQTSRLAVRPHVVELLEARHRRDDPLGARRDHDVAAQRYIRWCSPDRHAARTVEPAAPRRMSMPAPAAHAAWPVSS